MVLKASLKRENFIILTLVLCLHLLALYFLNKEDRHYKKGQNQKILVQTIQLQPKSPMKVPASTIAMAPKNEIIKKDTPLKDEPVPKKVDRVDKKKEVLPSPQKPTPTSTPKKIEIKKEPPSPTPKKIEPKKDSPAPKKAFSLTKDKIDEEKKKLISEALSSFSQIENKSNHSTFSQIKLESIDTSSFSTTENDYKNNLSKELKKSLQLPEFGKVELILTLDRKGHYISLKILSSESERNKNYVEKVLPTLTFSPLGLNFKGKNNVSFPITLINE